jgi:plastocyanin
MDRVVTIAAMRTAGALGLLLIATAAHGATVSATVATPSGEAVTQAVVYALPATGKAPSAPRPSVIDQIDREFVPLVVPVQAGAPVTFPNRDNIRHHVYSFSPAKVFELKLYSGVPAKPVVFDKPGAVTLGCNIHDWMVGHVYVVDSPWFAKTGKDGRATIDLPPGDYLIRVWHPWMKAEPAPSRLEVKGTTAQPLVLRLDIVPPPARADRR